MEQDVKAAKEESGYYFAKFNIKLDKPEYTEAQYETHLKSVDWDKSETDYLIELVHEWDLRWVVIADRYDYRPRDIKPQNTTSVMAHTQPKERSMEDMKSRYYQVASKIMALHRPLSQMSVAEFDIHQKMTKFDPASEGRRKRLAQGLQSRTVEEVQEEEMLLGELKRITGNHERFMDERKELYTRLDHPVSTSGSNAPLSSEELNVLWKNLSNADKSRKHRILSESLVNASPSASSQPPSTQVERNPRNSISSAADKRQSVSGPSTYRQLSARDEAKYGVSHHDRLTSGVQFRHERVAKLSLAKSNAQATKIGAALVELNIPTRLFMPTAKVITQYERLINSIHNLTESKKVTDKLENEIKVLQTQLDELDHRRRGGSRQDGGLSLESGSEVKQPPEQVERVSEAKVGNGVVPGPKADEDGTGQEEENAEAENEDDEEEEPNDEDDGEDDDGEEAEAEAEAEEADEEAAEQSSEEEDNDDDEDGGGGGGGGGTGSNVVNDENENDDDEEDEDGDPDEPLERERKK